MTSGVGENQNNKYILLCVYRDFVLLVRNLAVFYFFLIENIHDNQRDRVLPYQFELEPGMEASDSDDKSGSKGESESSDDEVDRMFEAKNAWRLELVWALGAGIAR